jgi:hypothetical protein
MGIPHLTAYLRPYATPVTWQRRGSTSDAALPEELIIDGPALAYHIYYQCLALRSGAGNALEAFPTYAELEIAVVLWLENIETFGLSV